MLSTTGEGGRDSVLSGSKRIPPSLIEVMYNGIEDTMITVL